MDMLDGSADSEPLLLITNKKANIGTGDIESTANMHETSRKVSIDDTQPVNQSDMLSPSLEKIREINRTISFRADRTETQQESSIADFRAKDQSEHRDSDIPPHESIAKFDSEEIVEENQMYRPLPSKLSGFGSSNDLLNRKRVSTLKQQESFASLDKNVTKSLLSDDIFKNRVDDEDHMTDRDNDLMGADIIVQPSEDFKSSTITKSQQPSKANPNSSTTILKGTVLS